MKKRLYEELTDPKEIQDNLEANSIEIQDNFKYVKPFTDVELREVESALSKDSVTKARIMAEMKALTEPLKAQKKDVDAEINHAVHNLDQGGIDSYGKVYCFEDFSLGLMGLYDSEGNLVGTRPLSRAERQLHINSQLNKAGNE